MNSREYTQNVLKLKSDLWKADDVDYDLIHSIMGCVTESSELLDVIKKKIFYNKEIDNVNLVEEFGDLLWYVALGLHVLGYTFEDVMDINIKKLMSRFPGKFNENAAKNRDLKTERDILEGEV